MSAHEPRLTGTKVCTSCNRELHVLSFAVRKQNSDGLMSVCRECFRPKARHRKSYISLRESSAEKKRERIKFHNQAYYKNHEET